MRSRGSFDGLLSRCNPSRRSGSPLGYPSQMLSEPVCGDEEVTGTESCELVELAGIPWEGVSRRAVSGEAEVANAGSFPSLRSEGSFPGVSTD